MAYIPPLGSVVAFQSDPTKLVGTVSVVGVLPVTLSGNPSISGTVLVNNGSVVAFQGGAWTSSVVGSVANYLQSSGGSVITVNQSSSILAVPVGSVITVHQGSIAAVIIGGSIASAGVANQSVSGTVNTLPLGTIVTSMVSTVPSSVLVGASIFGQLPAGTAVIGSVATLQGTSPWIVNFQNSSILSVPVGSTITVSQGSIAVAIISGSVAVATGNSSVMLLNGANVIGSVTALQGTLPWTISSIYGNISGSVVATISGTPNVNTAGSVVAFMGGTWKPSVIGLITRNDTIASFLGADLVERPAMGDAMGRTVIKPFASEDSTIISYVGSIVSGSVALIQASVIGKRSYITDFIISNTGSVTTLVTIQGGDTSILGQFIAPTGGGMVATGINIPFKTTLSQDLAFKVSPSSSILYLAVKGYQAQ